MSMSELLDTLTSKTQELLADQTITVHRKYTANSDPDPATLKRTEVIESDTCPAITGNARRVQAHRGGGFVTQKTFTICKETVVWLKKT